MPDGSIARVIDAVIVEHEQTPTALYDHAAEAAVIAAVMLDEGDARGVWRSLSPLLSPGHFHDGRHAALWAAITAIKGRGEGVDVLTLVAELKARGKHDRNTAQLIGEVTDAVITTAHCEAHAAIVRECAARRMLAEIGARLERAAVDSTKPALQLRDLAVEALRRVSIGASQRPTSAVDLVDEMWAVFDNLRDGKEPGPLPFYVPTLDGMSGGGVRGAGGMKRSGTYFVAGRPGLGKTAIACQIAGATAEAGEGVLYVALEPKRIEVMQAIHANRASVSLTKITRAPKLLTQDDVDALMAVSNRVAGWPLHVIDATTDNPPDTVPKIEAALRTLPSTPALLIVDHLLKLSPVGRHEKAYSGTAEVVSALVSLGKRTGVTVLVLCHIGRAVSGNSGLFRRPRAEDIAGGDAMNRDADGILILHREDKYPTMKESVGNRSLAGVVEVFAPKLRGVADNPFGKMLFRGEVQRFDAIADEPQESAYEPEPFE